MSHETIKNNPLLEHEGLSAEQAQQAERLYLVGGPEITQYPKSVSEKIDAKLGEQEAKRHLKKHESAYQVQAVKDAAQEGVSTNFGIEQSERIGYEAADLRGNYRRADLDARTPINLDLGKGPIYDLGHLIAKPLEKMADKQRVKKTVHTAKVHYEANQDTYQTQAKKEMEADMERRGAKAA